jgi:hypothetical protein
VQERQKDENIFYHTHVVWLDGYFPRKGGRKARKREKNQRRGREEGEGE